VQFPGALASVVAQYPRSVGYFARVSTLVPATELRFCSTAGADLKPFGSLRSASMLHAWNHEQSFQSIDTEM
jgi:hypothetical protein